ncbi:MAG: GGDEF domain-containing protein [Gammaproteobacteria bacterium]|nr:GGDEF domain-containing protein [Gammaproteobacteria bacterium]
MKQSLEACKTLPSPPGVATKIIALANDPEADIDQIANVLSVDPATTTRILRIANSAMYSSRRKSENLRQALLVLGLNATISLALSFSLLKSWQKDKNSQGLNYSLYWRRALLAATAGRVLARRLGIKDSEELFLTTLIQDIGVMALDQAVPDLYENLGDKQVHEADLTAHEREHIGCDHADVGGWLLERWSFPSRIVNAVAASHSPEKMPMSNPDGPFTRCVAVAGQLAEVFLENKGERHFDELAAMAEELLGIDKEPLGEVLSEVSSMIPDAEAVFQTKILSKELSDSILDEARETLMLRNLMALQRVDSLEDAAEELEERTKELEESSRRDPLTGLYNRAYLDKFLQKAFAEANAESTTLSIAFADLDKFKAINDTYGHGAGDQILVATANILKANVRGTDVVARYGGEEFVLVFPDTDFVLVKAICERIVRSFQNTRHDVGGDVSSLAVTISMGMATHNDGRRFKNSLELVTAADKALYTAKLQGRNRTIPYDAIADAKAAAV